MRFFWVPRANLFSCRGGTPSIQTPPPTHNGGNPPEHGVVEHNNLSDLTGRCNDLETAEGIIVSVTLGIILWIGIFCLILGAIRLLWHFAASI